MLKFKITFLLFVTLLIACSKTESNKPETYKKDLLTLKKEEAIINITIDNELFYKQESRFKGGANIDEKGLKISLKDQFNGNVIISMEGDKWYSKKPYRVNFTNGYPTGDTAGSFLIGKISDIINNVGEGYILFNGYYEIEYLDNNAFIMIVNGELKSPFGDAPLKKISGNIVWKNPGLKTSKIENNTFTIPFQ